MKGGEGGWPSKGNIIKQVTVVGNSRESPSCSGAADCVATMSVKGHGKNTWVC